MVSFILWYLTIASLLNSVAPQTLSLQGNVVNNPTKSTRETAPNLKECARICMDRPLCGMFVYNTNNRICEIATHFTATLTRNLNQYEVAYRRGTSCAPTRQMTLHTQKIGKFYSKQVGHRFKGPLVKEINGMERQEWDLFRLLLILDFCYAMYDVPECEMVPFGSADNDLANYRPNPLPTRNVVRSPTVSIIHHNIGTLKECAGICMGNQSCQMFIYNTNWKTCEIATLITIFPTKRLRNGRRIELRTRKMGLFSTPHHIHYYMPTFENGPIGTKPQDPLYCHAIEDIPACDVVSFGSANGGRQLTTNTKLGNFTHYGYCAPRQGTCGANVAILEYLVFSDYVYSTRTSALISGSGKAFCNFWGTGQKQCKPGQDSSTFTYEFQKKY